MKEFDLPTLKELTNKAIDPYLLSIEQALQAPQNQRLHREHQSALVKQMFIRSLRLISFDFSNEIDKYLYQLNQIEIEKTKKAKAKQEKAISSSTPKNINPNKKKTLKELRELRAERSEAKRGEAEERAKRTNSNKE